jgi:hypothetical protein
MTLSSEFFQFDSKIEVQCLALDFESAFLHGSLEEDIYMRIPDGYDPEEIRREKRVLILKNQSMV